MRNRWRLKCMGSEPTSSLKEIQNKKNEICFEMNSASAAIRISSGYFKWLLLILILLPRFGYL